MTARISIEFVPSDWSRADELVRLQYRVLYEPFGLQMPEGAAAESAEWMHPGPDTTIVVALAEDGALLGAARLLPAAGDRERQIRQVVVVPDARERGVGRALMASLEAHAIQEGAEETWLNARNSAYGFYGNVGYEFTGDEFISPVTGIPHRAMRKRLR